MKAIKFIDSAHNIHYVKGDITKVKRCLVKASIMDIRDKRFIKTKFFVNYSDLEVYLSQNPYKRLIGKGFMVSGLKEGYSKNNIIYEIEKVNK